MKFKIGDRVVYKAGTDKEDRGVVTDFDDTFVYAEWDRSGRVEYCFKDSLALEELVDSPLWKALA